MGKSTVYSFVPQINTSNADPGVSSPNTNLPGLIVGSPVVLAPC